MKALTGMGINEFKELIPVFKQALNEYYEQKHDRKRAPGGGKKGHLKTIEDKLFFILFYLKTYPTFDVLAFFSRKGRGRSCEAVHVYLSLIEKALGQKISLPKRKIRSVDEFLEHYPEVIDVFVDGTERRIQRPKKSKSAKRHYSGKKRCHTRKNVIVTDEKKRILVVSPTKPGRRHDKNCVDRIHFANNLPEYVSIWGDSGFQGLQHSHAATYIAKKGRKNKPLTKEEKESNTIISSLRIGVEHAIGGMKKYRVMGDVLRNKCGIFKDKIALVTAALWNYHQVYAF